MAPEYKAQSDAPYNVAFPNSIPASKPWSLGITLSCALEI